MNDKKRMAGDFEIINAIHIGDKEIVLGENPKATDNMKYFCGFCITNELFSSYESAMVSDDYAEMVTLFGKRIKEQAEKTKQQIDIVSMPKTPLTAADCYPNDYKESIDSKVIAIKTSAIRREYQTIDRQLYLVTGGFGAAANSRGTAVFCVNLYTGVKTRWERHDVQGVVKDSFMPQWAKEKLQEFQKQPTKETKSKEER